MKKFLIVLGVLVVVIAGAIGAFTLKTKMDMNKLDEIKTVDAAGVKDGTYTGEAAAGIVKAKVEVTVKDGVITDINLVEHENGKGKPAEATIDVMLAENTSEVDGVSGATCSSKTIRAAVNNALAQGAE